MKRLVLYFIFYVMICHYASKRVQAFVDPDAYRNVTELITSKGYTCEEHTVVTEDGYILSMQRIPHGKNNNTERGDKKVVLLIHGELGSTTTWFLNLPGQSLGYILPDAGFDVWMINDRGNNYSRKNKRYPVRSLKFWDWSFDEISKYDLTATIDYILNATGKESLSIIGYSRGNTVGFILLSELPEYNKKVKLLVALAPIAYVGYFTTPVRYLVPFRKKIVLGTKLISQGEFFPTNKITKIVTAKFCELQDLELCQNFFFAIGGQDRKQINMTRVPIYTAQYPSGTSIKILDHFAQLHASKRFRKFDYGPLRNMIMYKQATPPDYQLSRITSPIALFTSSNDIIADPTDVDIFRKEVKSIVYDFRDPDEEYSHFDWIWAKNAPEKIYKPIVELLSQY